MKHIKPGRGPSAMGALGSVIAVVFGIFWTVSAASMGAPISFSIFGVLFVIVGIVQAVYNFKNAAGKKRYSAFDIVDGEEEPDPLNQRFGGQPPEAVDTSGPEGPLRYCPYCGAKLGDSYTFCGHCGKRLPDVQEDDHP